LEGKKIILENLFNKMVEGEITVKGARGAEVKVLFQGLHMTRVIHALIYNFKFCMSYTPFSTAF
jgi:hypothetical protein